MTKNEEVAQLAEEIMVDITNNRLPLNNILLKASRLSLLINNPEAVKMLKEWAKEAEKSDFSVTSFETSMTAAVDPHISDHSNRIFAPTNTLERRGIREVAATAKVKLSHYRAEVYDYALGIYNKWRFGNVAESIFEKKRKRSEPHLLNFFPDINQRFNSIESNINSDNPEDWKSSVASCRTLFNDLADAINPAKNDDEKGKYINRLKDVISPKIESDSQRNQFISLLEEMKNRLETTIKRTQGGSHIDRPNQHEAEDVVLYTYLIIADIIEIYSNNQVGKTEKKELPTSAPKDSTATV